MARSHPTSTGPDDDAAGVPRAHPRLPQDQAERAAFARGAGDAGGRRLPPAGDAGRNPRHPREEVVVNEPVFTEAQAKERALAILSDRQKEMVTATGSTVGLPDLRAGRKVLLSGLGARFSGSYFLTETTHTIGASGYTTRFTARREDSAPGKGL